ncbi:cytochrome P450 [Vicingaceae bacterium]|nr:cytochrome P450 [Vicingaceae bacterium]MDC1452436.1 cytochrome P450 [Vicingaceae bacterium]|tara:strand:+ start:10435 stop:12591 length:2157 start_codon:yes stop_codon:yes gene_type:complete
MQANEIDISSWEFSQNPFWFYDKLRKNGPIHYLERNKTWLIIGFDEIIEVLNNSQVFTSEGIHSFDPILLNCDPPKHTKNRKILAGDQALFSSGRVSKLEQTNRGIAARLIREIKKDSPFDLLKEFALPFSSLVILDLLGLKVEEHNELKSWSQSAVSNQSIHDREYANKHWEGLKPIIKQWIENSKKNPENPGINEFIFHPRAIENFTTEDILNLTKVLLLGGNETTPNLVSSAILLLFNNPELLSKVKTQPDLIDLVINETLRLEAPTQIIQRTCLIEIEIGGQKIPKGSLVSLAIGAGNRDPNAFENPDIFNLYREKSRILSFGFGPHYCLGAQLSRQEAKISLELILNEFPELGLVRSQNFEYRYSSHVRGLNKLMLRPFKVKKQTFEAVRKHIIKLIKVTQLKTGEFPTYEYYPNTEELRQKGWHITAPSPFVHANVVLSLINLKNVGLESVIEKGTEFIRSQKEYGDVWRFWQLGVGVNNVPPDVDDTAICSAVLESIGKKLENKKLLEANITANGVLKTWIYPKLIDFFMRPRLSYKWWREKQYYQPTIDANLLNLNDYELGVMANTLLYLGENSTTKTSVEFCIDLWKENKDTNHFYNNEMVIAYHLARAYKGGVDSFEKLSADILEQIEVRFNTLFFPELLLAGLCIKYFKLTTDLKSQIAERVRSTVIEEDFVFPQFEYFTSKDRNYVAGSPMLVMCWFLELSEEWDC